MVLPVLGIILIALELRRMQMLAEIGIDNNKTTIVLVPSDFTNAAKSLTQFVNKQMPTEPITPTNTP